MTYLMIEDALSDEEELAQKTGLTVKCSWCGEIIQLTVGTGAGDVSELL